jgi:hypothetical protein
VAAYPYSFKLLWSPIVDSFYSTTFGRRKSWLVPLQLISAAVMFAFAPFVEAHIAAANVPAVSALFFILVLLAATQVRPGARTTSEVHVTCRACASAATAVVCRTSRWMAGH